MPGFIRPSSSAKLMGVDIRFNSFGHRGPEPDLAHREGRKIVFVLGSSVTMGWGVEERDVFTNVAARSLPNVDFLNAGIGSYTTAGQYQIFESQYERIKPDAVVLHYFISDAEQKPKSGGASWVLKHSQLAQFLYERLKKAQLAASNRGGLEEHYRELYADDSAAWKHTQELVRSMKERLDRDHVPFVVMMIPEFRDLAPGSSYRGISTTRSSGRFPGGDCDAELF